MKQGKNAAPRASARNYHSGPESEAEAADIRCAAIDERRAVLTAPSRSVDAQKPEPSVERLGALDLRRVLQPASATATTPPGLRRPPLTAQGSRQGSSSKLPKGRKARSGDVKVQLGSLTPARPPWLGVDFESEYEERRKFDFKNSDIEESDFRGSEDIEDGEARAPPGLAARSAMHRAPRRRAKSACSSYRAYLRDSPLRASSLTAMIIMSFGERLSLSAPSCQMSLPVRSPGPSSTLRPVPLTCPLPCPAQATCSPRPSSSSRTTRGSSPGT